MLRGRGSNQIRVQDQHCVSVSPHGSHLTENGKSMHTGSHTSSHTVTKITVFHLYSLPLFKGPHLQTTVVDVHLRLHHTPLTVAPPTLQRLHLRLHFHFTSSELLSVQHATTSTKPTNKETSVPKRTSRRRFSQRDERRAKDCAEIILLCKLAFFFWTP